jgi:hypothetical protein
VNHFFFCDFGTDSVTRWVHVQRGLVDFFSFRPPRRLGTASVSKTIEMSSLRPPATCSEVTRIFALSIHIFFHELFAFSKCVHPGRNWWELVVLLAGIGGSWREFLSARESGGSRGEAGAWRVDGSRGRGTGGSRRGTGAGAWD